VPPLLAELQRRHEPTPVRCRHRHRSAESRALCEQRLRRTRTG
jgi:hypothetical protein